MPKPSNGGGLANALFRHEGERQMKIRITIEAVYTPSEGARKHIPGDLAQQWLADYDLDCMVQEGTFTKVEVVELPAKP